MKIFIVGNGPSLAQTNLDLIAGQPSFACNNIHLIYDKTKWRPTMYVRPEGRLDLPNELWVPSVEAHVKLGIPTYLSRHYEGRFDARGGRVIYLQHCHHHAHYDDPTQIIEEWHLPQLCIFGGSVSIMMQLAYLQGYDEQILLGCDLEYKNHRPSHFDPHYEHGHEQPAHYANRDALWGHVCVKNSIGRGTAPNLKVYNATIGGDLHLYERVRLEDVA